MPEACLLGRPLHAAARRPLVRLREPRSDDEQLLLDDPLPGDDASGCRADQTLDQHHGPLAVGPGALPKPLGGRPRHLLHALHGALLGGGPVQRLGEAQQRRALDRRARGALRGPRRLGVLLPNERPEGRVVHGFHGPRRLEQAPGLAHQPARHGGERRLRFRHECTALDRWCRWLPADGEGQGPVAGAAGRPAFQFGGRQSEGLRCDDSRADLGRLFEHQ
mmetsp:Transcript_1736/g.6803  ORF Transcript_1736/g.6803 Transcript_1736/m.6803 type:complete len:221 (+) Transcript_1736:880-1542(+)